jgi:hypothetical protein
MYEVGRIGRDEYEAKCREIDEQRARLTERPAPLFQQQHSILRSLVDEWDGMTTDERRKVLSGIFDSVTATSDGIDRRLRHSANARSQISPYAARRSRSSPPSRTRVWNVGPYELRCRTLMTRWPRGEDNSAVYRILWALFVVAVVASVVSSGRTSPSSAIATSSPTPVPSPLPTASPEFHPAPGALGGRVVRLVPDGLVVELEGREVEVNLKLAVDVWKETTVAASALAVGDDVFINGTAGSPFVARYVWANIGRIDGIVRAVDATGMNVERLAPKSGVVRVDFSAYLEFGAPAAGLTLTRADLVVGRTIGAVVYRPSLGPLRATRVW